MPLSAPIFRLKREARALARATGVPLHESLDRIARREGFRSWSHLARVAAAGRSPAVGVLGALQPGDLALIGARPGHGKTLLGLSVVAEAARAGRPAHVFTLEESEASTRGRLEALGHAGVRVDIDTSDAISAGHIADRLAGAAPGSVALVDYLQILDQDRAKPPLGEQVRALAAFARTSGTILVVLSQIDRRFESSTKALPDLADVRRPNPVDLSAFSQAVFLNDGAIAMGPS